MGRIPHLHHVNLGIPVGGTDVEAAWLIEVLGYQRLDPDPEMVQRGACWFEGDDGTQIHLSQDPEHRPAARAHVAVELDSLEPVRRELDERGQTYRYEDRDTLSVLHCTDPAGNRWELRTPESA
jgi:hypothetical protein